jgi:A/G-specific adenine glycosylase
VASFAFGIPATVVDTNVRRVEARAVTGNALPEKSYTRAEAALAHDLMPDVTTAHGINEANRWNAASMELGALICKARTPLCQQCPVQHRCAWIAAGRPEPHYTPKGQAWEGTDRQVRGAMMAVLRAAEAPVDAGLLRGVGQVVAHETPEATKEITALRRLKADAAQRERCLAGLLKDGLAVQTGSGVTLPA